MDCSIQQAMEGGGTEQIDELEISQRTCPAGSPCGTTEEHWVDTIVRSKLLKYVALYKQSISCQIQIIHTCLNYRESDVHVPQK